MTYIWPHLTQILSTLSKYHQHEDTGSWVRLSGCISVFEMCICVRSGQEQSHDVIEIKTFFFISFLFFFFFFLVCAVPSAAPQNLSLEVRNSKVKLYIAFVHFYW